MPRVFTHTFKTDAFKGDVTVNTDLYINGQFVAPVDGETFEYVRLSLLGIVLCSSRATESSILVRGQCYCRSIRRSDALRSYWQSAHQYRGRFS